MPKFSKEVLCPGVYFVGGRKIAISADDCRDFYLSLNQLRAAGLHVPLVLEHPDKDRDPKATNLGFPVEDRGSLLADELRRTVGFADLESTQTRLNNRGGIEIAFDVPDQHTAQQLADKRIRFVSPELLIGWQDGKGRDYHKLMSHIALTHRPIQVDQVSGFVQLSTVADVPRGVVQLSMEDLEAPTQIEPITWEGVTMAKDTKAAIKRRLNNAARLQLANMIAQFSDNKDNYEDEDAGSNGGDSKPKDGGNAKGGNDNPDMPKNGDAGDKQFEALIAHLTKLGLALPTDTDETNLVDRLLTSVMTYNAVSDAHDAKDADDKKDDAGATEELSAMGTAQFSAAQGRDKLVERIRACQNLPGTIRDRLLVNVGSVQFSDAGAEVVPAGAIGIGELVSTYEREATQFSAGSPQSKIVDRLKALKDRGAITPGVHDQLLSKVGRLQFSDSGAEVASGLSMSEVLDQYEQQGSITANFLNDAGGGDYQFSSHGGGGHAGGSANGSSEVKHPKGRDFLSGGGYLKSGSKEAIQLSSGILQRAGLKPRSVEQRGLAVNASNLGSPPSEDD